MARYRRINIDGQSLYKTETRKVAAASLPGTFACMFSTLPSAKVWVLLTPFLLVTPHLVTTWKKAANWQSCVLRALTPKTPRSSWAQMVRGRLPTLTPTPFSATARTMQLSQPALPTLSACASA